MKSVIQLRMQSFLVFYLVMLCSLVPSIAKVITSHEEKVGSGSCLSANKACNVTENIDRESSGNLLAAYNMTNEVGCIKRCFMTSQCKNWTWWGDTELCQLFSKCSQFQTGCVDCQTGPKSCGIEEEFVSAVSGGMDPSQEVLDEMFMVQDKGLCRSSLNLTMPIPRWGHSSSFIKSKMILCGGTERDGSSVIPSNSCDIFNLDTQTWSGSEMTTARHKAAGIPLLGKMYMIGGENGTGPTSTMEVYEPSKDEWIPGPEIPLAVSRPCAVAFRDVVILSGGTSTSGEINRVFVFNVTTQTWNETTPMNQTRGGHGCSLNIRQKSLSHPKYEVIVTGGENENKSLDSVEAFDLETQTWTDIHPLPFTLESQVQSDLGSTLVLGGLLTGVASPIVLQYSGDGWRMANYNFPKGRAGHSVASYPRDLVDC